MSQKSIAGRAQKVQLGDVLSARKSEAKAAAEQQAAPQRLSTPATPVETFEAFYVLGYTLLVPIVPPDAPISDKSSLLKRPGARGKAVGVKGHNGWHGFDWINYEATDADLERWQAMGAGIGIKTGLQPDGSYLVLIDADTLNEEWARIIRDVIEQKLGKLAVRIGRYPKAGYVVRLSEPMQYTRIEFGEVDEKGRLKDRVEILSDGRQFVAHGIHPATGKPYTWPRGVPSFAELPLLHPDQIREVLETLRYMLPNGKPLVTEGSKSSAVVDQASLKGDVDTVREAVSLIPNKYEAREDYISVGVAIKAATQDDEAAGLEIYQEWCARWDGGDNDPDVVEADWRRFKPPYRRGANWLYELAEQHAPDKFNRAATFFEVLPEEEKSPFEIQHEATKEVEEPVSIEWIDPRRWKGVPVAPMEWEVEGLIPKNEVVLLTGDGGVGKTLLLHQYATCAVTGVPFLGLKTRQTKVMAVLCEDRATEIHRRQASINSVLGVEYDQLDGLRIACRRNEDNVLCTFARDSGLMKLQQLWKDLRDEALAFEAGVLILDTLPDFYNGSEIDRNQVSAFVKGCLGRLADEIGGTVILLAHPSRAGKATGEGTSGSTAWHNSVRARLYLEHPRHDKGSDKDSSTRFRRLTNPKQNYGRSGAELTLRWDRGAFSLVGGKGLLASGVQTTALKDMAERAVAAFLVDNPHTRLETEKSGSMYYAPKVLKKEAPEEFAAFSRDDIGAAVRRLIKRGALRKDEVGRDSASRPLYGLAVVPDKIAAAEDCGVFA